jgi:MFS family permease
LLLPPLPLPLRRYLAVLALFAFARASETFIVLRGHELGAGTIELLLLWSALNLAKAATSTAGGRLADRVGRPRVLLLAWTLFALSFLLFGKVDSAAGLWAVTVFYGACFGLGEGAERAAISDYGDRAAQGTAFGWYHLVGGIAAIPAGLLFGSLWAWQSAALAFFFAAGVAAVAALLLRAWAWPGNGATSGDRDAA